MLARLLGVKLLTLEGTVVASPAQTRNVPQTPATSAVEPAGGAGVDWSAERGIGPAPVTGTDQVVGARLGLAVQLLRESSHDLHSIKSQP